MEQKQSKRTKYLKDGQFEIGQRFNPYKRFVGSFIPNALMEFRKLSPQSKLLWGRLAQYMGEGGECFPSNKELAIEIGTTEDCVEQIMGELRRGEFIETQYNQKGIARKDRRRFVYFLIHPCLIDELTPDPGSGVSEEHLTKNTDHPTKKAVSPDHVLKEVHEITQDAEVRESLRESIKGKEGNADTGNGKSTRIGKATENPKPLAPVGDHTSAPGQGTMGQPDIVTSLDRESRFWKAYAVKNCPRFRDCQQWVFLGNCFKCPHGVDLPHIKARNDAIATQGFCCGMPEGEHPFWMPMSKDRAFKDVCRDCEKFLRLGVAQMDVCPKVIEYEKERASFGIEVPGLQEPKPVEHDLLDDEPDLEEQDRIEFEGLSAQEKLAKEVGFCFGSDSQLGLSDEDHARIAAELSARGYTFDDLQRKYFEQPWKDAGIQSIECFMGYFPKRMRLDEDAEEAHNSKAVEVKARSGFLE